jgi:uncharacterized protein (TIGR03083 family)
VDLPATYATARAGLTSLVIGLDPDLPVPGTPGWSAHDVVAHVAGVAQDVATGNLAGAPGDAWTRAQVERGSALSVAELIAGWKAAAPAVEEALRANPLAASNVVFDTLTHLDDVREGADVVDTSAEHHLLVLKTFARHIAGGRIAAAGLPALQLVCADTGDSAVAGAGDPGATVTGTRYELVRVLSGRRTRDAALALSWSGDPAPYLEHLPLFAWAGEHAGG